MTGSMLSRLNPIRLIATVVLALAVTCCCCDFRAVLGGCDSCGSDVRPAANDDGGQGDVGANSGEGAHSHCRGQAPDDEDERPATPHEHPANHNHEDCACGKSSGKILSIEKTMVEPTQSVVVAVLDWSGASEVSRCDPGLGRERERRGAEQPPTTLLSMHCALTV